MRQQFTAVYKKSGKWFIGWIEEVPGVNTQGKTLKELRENLKDALALVLEANKTLSDSSTGRIQRETITLSRS